jgi:hypothetical protein
MGINADGSALAAFNPFGIVSRGEFASMLVRFSKNVLNKKDPEESVCNFVDMSALDQEYQSAALWLCDKGVMGL